PVKPVINTNQVLGGAAGTNVGTGGALGTPGGTNGSAGQFNGTQGSPGSITLLEDDDSAPASIDQNNSPNRKRGKRKVAVRQQAESNHLSPVSFVQPVLELCDRQVAASNALLTPRRGDTTAAAGTAKVHVRKGCAAFVINSGGQISVLALHDTANGDV